MRYIRPIAVLLITLALCAGQASAQRLFYRAADGEWRSLAATATATGLRFVLDPAEVGGPATVVVIDPPADAVLDDSTPPRVTGLKLDGRPYSVAKWPQDLDWLASHPSEVAFGLQDSQNMIGPANIAVLVNGERADPATVTLTPARGGRSITVRARLADLLRRQGRFENRIRLAVTDSAPMRNGTEAEIVFRCLEQVKALPAVLVDSATPGYEDVSVLTDGTVMEPGKTTFGVTWASAEEPGDHWVVLAWPKERVWGKVTVHWAVYSGIYWASRKLFVEAWDGRAWVVKQTLDHIAPEPVTTIDLTGLKSSRLRLRQPNGQGHADRPDLMWITEIDWSRDAD